MLPASVAVPISRPIPARQAMRAGRLIAGGDRMGFGELRQGQLAIIVTEAAANIAAHAGRG